MKKITTSGDPITFRVDGSTVITITKEGVLASDEHAAVLADRLGGNIEVSAVTLEEAAAEVLEAPVEEAPAEEPVAEAPAEEAAVEEAPVVEAAPKKKGKNK